MALGLPALAGGVPPALAQDLPRLALDARPVAVTVFPDQAMVSRSGSLDIPAGDSLAVLSGLPAGIVAESLTVRGSAAEAVAIGAVELRPASFEPAAANRRRAELEAAIRALEDEMAAIDARLLAWTAQTALIERLAGGFADAQRRPPPSAEGAPRIAIEPARWREAWDAVRQGTEEAAEASRQARLQRRELEARKAALAAELATLGRRAPGTLEIAVALRAERATRLELAVAYQRAGARWAPAYELRLDSASGRLLLRQEALVSQSSGEDWNDVAVTLSTARPSADSGPPALQPWRIALLDPARQDRAREGLAMRGAPSAPAGAAEQQAQAPRDAVAVAATVVASGFAVEYRIPGRASLRSDGSERRLRIGEHAAEAALSVRAVPRLDRRGFLTARFANPSPTPALAGQAALYLDGVFVGRTALPLLRPQEELALPFGADDRVRIAYEPQLRRRSADGSLLTGRTTSEGAEALITVTNFHDRPIEITVLDQAPVSGEEQLVVTVSADPPPSLRDVEDRPGVLAWTATYRPQEERRIRFGYTVTAPRDRVVTGMGR